MSIHGSARPERVKGQRFMWRVAWARSGWSLTSSGKSRFFATETAAMRFVDLLLDRSTAKARAWSPVDRLELHRRPVGTWEEVPLSAPQRARLARNLAP